MEIPTIIFQLQHLYDVSSANQPNMLQIRIPMNSFVDKYIIRPKCNYTLINYLINYTKVLILGLQIGVTYIWLNEIIFRLHL